MSGGRAEGSDRENESFDEIEVLIGRTKEEAPARLDARVLAVLTASDRQVIHRNSWRRVAAVAAVGVALVTLTFAAVQLFRGEGEATGDSVADASNSGGNEGTLAVSSEFPAPVDSTELLAERVKAGVVVTLDRPADVASSANDGDDDPPGPLSWASGWPPNVDVRALVTRAELIARLRVIGTLQRTPGPDRPIVEVVHVYKGDPALIGKRLELHRHVEQSEHAFFAWDDQFNQHLLREGLTFITSLKKLDRPPRADGLLHYEQEFAEEYGGVIVASALPLPPLATNEDVVVGELIADLIDSLPSSEAGVRRSVMSALLNLDDRNNAPVPQRPSSLWRDALACERLLDAGRDADPFVRQSVAQMQPQAAGEEGAALQRELFFDEDPLVSWAASSAFGTDPGLPIFATLRETTDYALDDLLTRVPQPEFVHITKSEEIANVAAELTTNPFPEFRKQYVIALGRFGDPAAAELLVGALSDEEVDVRRAAAWALGSAGRPQDGDRLEMIAATEDPSVCVMAAASQIKLGDVRGFDHLAALLDSGSARAADQVVRVVEPLLQAVPDLRGIALLVKAIGHRNELVRGRVLVACARLAARDPAFAEAVGLDAAIAAAAASDSELLRSAATAAHRARIHRLSEREWEMLRTIGYGR